MYIQLVKISDTPAFVKAVESNGWDKNNYHKILNVLCDYDGYITNCNITTHLLPTQYKAHIASIYIYTDEERTDATAWCLIRTKVYVSSTGDTWVRESDVEV